MFESHDLHIDNVTIRTGESAIKECSNIIATNCRFEGNYPFWHVHGFKIDRCYFDVGGRSALWYSDHLKMTDTVIDAPKMFREMSEIDIENVIMNDADEVFWRCNDIRIKNLKLHGGTYPFMFSNNIYVDGLESDSKYVFQYVKNVEIHHAKITTKDAFWEVENVTIYDSELNGEYLGWHSKNLHLVNCHITGEQPLCYAHDLVLENCTFGTDCDRAFEYSTLQADIRGAITNIKKHPISERKLKNVTSEHLQAFFDLLSFGGTYPDGSERKGYSKDYIRSFSAVLQQSFRFAVSPKQYITFNPMQYIKLKYQTDEVDLFSDDDMDGDIQPIPREDYERLIEFLQDYNPPAILPIQIAYYAGLRIGEACGLAWQDVNLEEQCLTIRRSIRYDGSRHKNIIGPTKRKKVRIVDFGDTLAEILRNARKEQLKNRMQYGELYHKNYYREVKDKNRVYYEFYHLDGTENVPEDYKEISFVCLRPDGSLELPSTLGIVCRKIAQKLDGFEGFHFHQLRHTYTSNLLANGAAPKDVQELLGHSDVSTTMNVYAHSTRKAKRESARLLDKVAGND